jgi:acyl-CoA thioesterase-2
MAGMEDLLSILDLERLEHNLFRGRSPQDGWRRVFGGQVVGQALVAASRTVDAEDRLPHSLHAYFLLGGDPKVPIIYEVNRIRDGKSFTTRNVVAIQHGEAIFSMSASFHKPEEGFDHQIKMPVVTPPEDLPSDIDLIKQHAQSLQPNFLNFLRLNRPIELRNTDIMARLKGEKMPPNQSVWIKAKHKLPDDLRVHQFALAYASDYSLLDTALVTHGRYLFDPSVMLASLDHSIWFHRPFRADEWLLYVQDSPSAQDARGFCRGSIFARDGKLVASIAQEGLIRIRRPS